MNINFLHGGLV